MTPGTGLIPENAPHNKAFRPKMMRPGATPARAGRLAIHAMDCCLDTNRTAEPVETAASPAPATDRETARRTSVIALAAA